MTVPGKLNVEEALRVRRLVGGGRWYRLTLPHLGIAIFLIVPVLFAVQVFYFREAVAFSDGLWVWLGSPAIAFVIWIFSRWQDQQALNRLIGELPATYDFEIDGIIAKYGNGVKTFVPFTAFAGWRLEECFLILEAAKGQVASVISLCASGEEEQNRLKELLSRGFTDERHPETAFLD